uniref:Uncharacterized protein n=1 Tax=Chelonoidis abingdonii TaxID=106734 RepID=A0A8C0IQ48_CHEAB
MSYPCNPPPYSDKNPLIPLQPEDYSQLEPSALGYLQPPGYPQLGACAGGYLVPGGYAPSAGYPQPEAPRPVIPMHLGKLSIHNRMHLVGMLHRNPVSLKVYTIISVQLLVTMGIIAVFTFVTTAERRPRAHRITLLGSEPRVLAPICTWRVKGEITEQLLNYPPQPFVCSVYHTRAVLITMVITAKVAIIVTVFCFQTKVDFTLCTGLFCVLGIVVVQTLIATAIVLYYKYIQWVHMVFVAMVAIAFTLILAYDTQLLVGNKQYGLSPEEYIFGALEIYVDIVYIFFFLLRFLGWK